MRDQRVRWILLCCLPLLAACQRSTGDAPAANIAAGENNQAANHGGVRNVVVAAEPSSSGANRLTQSGEHNPQREIADPYYLVGRELGEWHLGEWANSRRLSMADMRGQTLVVRFWTDAPDEAEDSLRSLKAIELLKTEFAGRPVTFVGLYHSKGSLVETSWDDVVRLADANKLTLPLAYDRQWTTLNEWWRRRFDHLPTTATFVVSPEGKITYVHPGPAYFPSDRPIDAICNADFRALREAIMQELPQRFADR